MKSFLIGSLVAVSFSAYAEVISLQSDQGRSSVYHQEQKSSLQIIHDIEFDIKRIKTETLNSHPEFVNLSEDGIAFSKTIGVPVLPYKSLVVIGKPQDIEVTIEERDAINVSLIPAPGQEEDCRCADQEKKWIPLRKNSSKLFEIDYLGKYRGQELSRVILYGAKVDLERKQTTFYPRLKAQVIAEGSTSELHSLNDTGSYDYLIVSPRALVDGLSQFVTYKTQKGLKVKTVILEDVGRSLEAITSFFKSEYRQNNYRYALIVGNDDLFPNHKVRTSGSSQTPSDYPYFLMDQNDMIPDVHYGRIVASTVSEVSRQTAKWIDYEEHSSEASQYLHMIGIASNEGSNPSDDEYVKGMERDLKNAYGTVASHFYQNDATSKPSFINQAFNKGASFLVYLGHGSGTSWASTGTYYTTSNIKEMNNASVLKPVVIDVACQNGILKKGYLGETFMNATNSQGNAIGAAMYYGGSVNISWHPPAIMARGLVKRTIANSIEIVGDAILAGHLYLMENHTELEEVRDNFEWYHLFGEPSAPIYFK